MRVCRNDTLLCHNRILFSRSCLQPVTQMRFAQILQLRASRRSPLRSGWLSAHLASMFIASAPARCLGLPLLISSLLSLFVRSGVDELTFARNDELLSLL